MPPPDCRILYRVRMESAAACFFSGSSASISAMRCSLASIFAWSSSTRCSASS